LDGNGQSNSTRAMTEYSTKRDLVQEGAPLVDGILLPPLESISVGVLDSTMVTLAGK
jgi:hypothetical protein